VVRQQHQTGSDLASHRRQRTVAAAPRPGFDALALRGFARQAMHPKEHVPAAARPLDPLRPGVSLGCQAVVHMQRHHVDTQLTRGQHRATQQCH
jgi:hypothetical protein